MGHPSSLRVFAVTTLLLASVVSGDARQSPVHRESRTTDVSSPALAAASKRQEAAAVRALIQRGMDVNAALPDGATALHWTAHWDDTATAALLVNAGAVTDARNDYGVTPLL